MRFTVYLHIERTIEPLGIKMLHAEDQKNKSLLLRKSPVAFLRRFGRDEGGGIIILTLLLLITMLVMGGMAVDFMRFESKRSLLQSVSDRAVLSAASLDQDLDCEEVIIDFFDHAGFDGAIVGRPDCDKTPLGSVVRVDSQIDVNTFYLRLIGIDTLSAPAASSAIQGTGNVEISLVLDISGSMRHNATVDGETKSKMAFLQDAASGFIDDLLLDDSGNRIFQDRISINLIPYSQQVALGDDLYKALRTSPDSININDEVGSSYIEDNYNLPVDPADPPVDPLEWANGLAVFTNPSRCIDFEDEDFLSVEFNTQKRYEQVERFEHYSSSNAGIDRPVCPDMEFETILPLSQDAVELKRRINLYRPTTYTSIHLGVKWGLSLLDHGMQDVLGGLASIDPAFRDSRPSDAADTTKYLVVMTDGQNVDSRRILPEYYSTYEWRTIWATDPWEYWWNTTAANDRPSNSPATRNALTHNPGSYAQFNTRMVALCDDARANNIIVYTVAMGAGATGAAEIAKCAHAPAYAFSTEFGAGSDDEPGISEIFEKIAEQVNALRLSL